MLKPKTLLRTLPLSLLIGAPLWVLLSRVGGSDILWSYGIGMLVSTAILLLLYAERLSESPLKPDLFIWLARYAVFLTWDVAKAGLSTTRLLWSSREIKAGIIRVPVQDQRAVVSGMTAHGITITPGELVVHFGRKGSEEIVYVHCLDLESSTKSIEAAQRNRIHYYHGMFGKPDQQEGRV